MDAYRAPKRTQKSLLSFPHNPWIIQKIEEKLLLRMLWFSGSMWFRGSQVYSVEDECQYFQGVS